MIARYFTLFIRFLVLSSTASMLTMLGACGAAESAPAAQSPESKSPDTGTAREPTSIAEAQALIAAAKAELGNGGPGAFASPPHPPAEARTSEPPASSQTSPVLPSKPSTLPAPGADSAPKDRCGGPCRALASMRRAVTALCRMTGGEDARCLDAKQTLADSERRIAPCSCRGPAQ